MSLNSLCPLEGEGEGIGHSDRQAPLAATDPNTNLMERMLDGLGALSSQVRQSHDNMEHQLRQSNENGEHRMNSLVSQVRQINDNVEQRLSDLATSSEQEWNSLNRQFEELAHRQFDMDEVLSTLVGRPTVLSTGPIRDRKSTRLNSSHS